MMTYPHSPPIRRSARRDLLSAAIVVRQKSKRAARNIGFASRPAWTTLQVGRTIAPALMLRLEKHGMRIRLLLAVTAALTADGTLASPLEDGIAAYERYDFSQARDALAPVAAQGSAKAQGILGSMYMRGEGVPLNAMVAAGWLRRAAEQGNMAAQSNLGRLYFHGRGVRRNYGEAVRWFRSAALQGDVSAQACLAGLYAIGEGVERDYVLAHVWYSRAVTAANNEFDVSSLRELEKKMTPEQREAAARLLRDGTARDAFRKP
jgi:TPR repeat protein